MKIDKVSAVWLSLFTKLRSAPLSISNSTISLYSKKQIHIIFLLINFNIRITVFTGIDSHKFSKIIDQLVIVLSDDHYFVSFRMMIKKSLKLPSLTANISGVCWYCDTILTFAPFLIRCSAILSWSAWIVCIMSYYYLV